MDLPLLALCAFAALGSQSASAMRPEAASRGGNNMSAAPEPHVSALLEGRSAAELAHALPVEVLAQALLVLLQKEGLLDDPPALEGCAPPAESFTLPHKRCPNGDSDLTTCVAHNANFATFAEAWQACGEHPECGVIMKWTSGRYYLRRESDPDEPADGAASMLYSCSEQVSARSLPDAPVDVDDVQQVVSNTVEGINELKEDIQGAIEAGELDPQTMSMLVSAVLLISAWALLFQLYRTVRFMTLGEMWEAWLKPVIMVPFFTYTTFRIYEVARGEPFDLFSWLTAHDNDVLRMLMLLSVMWWGFNFTLEVVVYRQKEFKDRVSISASDVYANFTEPMFNVGIRFIVQCTLMMVLIYQAQLNAHQGHPEMRIWRRWFNFGFALSLQFFLWVRQSRTWEDLFRLKSTMAVEFSDKQGNPTVIKFPWFEFYIRTAMSILTNGIFHKFLILSYPLFIFCNYGTSQGQELVRQALSITMVLSLDNLGGSKTFIAHKVAPEEVEVQEEEEKAAEGEDDS